MTPEQWWKRYHASEPPWLDEEAAMLEQLREQQQWQYERDQLFAKLHEILDRAKMTRADPKASQTSKRAARMAEIFVQQTCWHLPTGQLAPVRAASQALQAGMFADDHLGKEIKLATIERDHERQKAKRKAISQKGVEAKQEKHHDFVSAVHEYFARNPRHSASTAARAPALKCFEDPYGKNPSENLARRIRTIRGKKSRT